MSSPEPIPPPNDRRGSRASSNADSLAHDSSNGIPVGHPPGSPSPLQIRASKSANSKDRRRTLVKQPPDFHLLEYVSQPDNNLICLICHAPYDKPVQLLCSHYFCRDCLDHAWQSQRGDDKSCPTCRGHVDPETDVQPAPKILLIMLDELVVRCPNARLGCSWAEQRSSVHDHVMLYCEYALVECSSLDCRLPISQKDFHKGCLHYSVACDDCCASMTMDTFEEHQESICPNRWTHCPHCRVEVLRMHRDTHIKNLCEKAATSCEGSLVGCTFIDERSSTLEHEKSCPMARMAPYFREQQKRIERSEASLEPLLRKVGILEDGLSHITNMLYPVEQPVATAPPVGDIVPLDLSTQSSSVDNPGSASSVRLPSATPATAGPTDPPSNQPTLDSQVGDLLRLHEALRDEVRCIENELSEDSRHTKIMVMRETQRLKEDMSCTNAVISNMRHQLQWLVSATLHQRSASGAAGSATPGRTNAAPGAARAAQAGQSVAAGATLYGPPRRLSDSTRQDTKL